MTIFEKIYFTCLIISIVLFCIGCIIAVAGDESIGMMLCEPFGIQLILTILYLVVKLILLIWGVEMHWFPSLRIGGTE